jgi:hypothetical protein
VPLNRRGQPSTEPATPAKPLLSDTTSNSSRSGLSSAISATVIFCRSKSGNRAAGPLRRANATKR